MSTKFTLTVTVEGDSLDQVDEGLVQAAGQRLMARMQNPPVLSTSAGLKVTTDILETKKTRPGDGTRAPRVSREIESEKLAKLLPAKTALEKLYLKDGNAAVETVLAHFGIARLRDLPDDQIEIFVDHVKAEIGDTEVDQTQT